MTPQELTYLFGLLARFTSDAHRATLKADDLALLEVFLRKLGENGMAERVVDYYMQRRDALRVAEMRAIAMLN